MLSSPAVAPRTVFPRTIRIKRGARRDEGKVGGLLRIKCNIYNQIEVNSVPMKITITCNSLSERLDDKIRFCASEWQRKGGNPLHTWMHRILSHENLTDSSLYYVVIS